MITIQTDNKWRNLLAWYELTEKEKRQFDWIENGDDCGESFFRYRGGVYCLGEFTRIDNSPPWDGAFVESFFSAVYVQVSPDGEQVKVGLALS